MIPVLDRGEQSGMFFNISPSWGIGKVKMEEMETKIKAYLNPYCPWSPGVCRVLEKFGLEYEVLDISRDRDAYEEMVRKSRQYSSPCVEIALAC